MNFPPGEVALRLSLAAIGGPGQMNTDFGMLAELTAHDFTAEQIIHRLMQTEEGYALLEYLRDSTIRYHLYGTPISPGSLAWPPTTHPPPRMLGPAIWPAAVASASPRASIPRELS